MTAAASETDVATEEERSLEAMVRVSPLRLFVIRLSDSTFTEVSDALVEFAGRPRSELLSMRLLDYVIDPDVAGQSLGLLAEGKIDGYTRRAGYRRPSGGYTRLTIRITAFADHCPRTRALATVLEGEPEAPSLELAEPGDDPTGFVLGTVDAQWRIDRITNEVGHLLDRDAAGLLGTSAFTAVHPEDISQLLLLASQATARHGGASGRVRLRNGEGGWTQCRLAVLPLAGSTPGGFAFALSSVAAEPPVPTTRTRELEDHLRRIGREVTASGVAALASEMPTALEVPELGTLTAREYEIVVRLASGERTPAIARRLFLSESTVRNHLTAVYRKFGVMSQSELLTRLVPEARAGDWARAAATEAADRANQTQ
ncbi:MAG: Response regulator containing a CheY-like receiver domain and an DNA-binding domain [Frankiales bacterium]|nr:Response regulator containing a CheY-like receiver domain and an DNA-binding domain [Frankiales bacterium]